MGQTGWGFFESTEDRGNGWVEKDRKGVLGGTRSPV